MKKQAGILLIAAGLTAASAQEVFRPDKTKGWTPALTADNEAYTVPKAAPRILSAEIFKVDPDAVYELSGKFRSDGSGPKNKLLFFGAEAYTAGNKLIGSPQVNIFPGTETELAKDLKKGDKTVYVKDASKWNRKNRAAVIAYGIRDDLADLPNPIHSPNIAGIEEESGMWAVHLQRPSWNVFPAGTRVREHAHGMGRNFFGASYRKINSGEWVEIKGTISGIAPHGAPARQWWRGTAAAKICIQATPGVQFKDIVLKKTGGPVEILPPMKKAVPPAARKKASAALQPLTDKYYAQLPKEIKRPRVIFNDAAFEQMRLDMRKNPDLKAGFDRLRGKVDAYPDEITEKAYRKTFYSRDKFGPTALRCAFVWKLTGEGKYRDKGLKLLKAAAQWYNARYAAAEPVDWTAFSRIDALCAYDWMYETMTDAERKEIGRALFDHMKAAQNLDWINKSGAHTKGEGTSPWSSSFYGTPLLKFYAGLTFLKAGIDDPAAERYLKEGLSDHLKMLTFRASMAGADGGGNNSTPGYAFGDGPVCEWYFYHTWRNLTGHNIAMDFPGNGMLPHWLFYATFPGLDGSTLEHGSGGAWHMDNKLKMNLRHLAQYRKFYDRHPAAWLVDYFIAQQDEFKDDGYIYKSGSWSFTGYPPWLPFMFKYNRRADYKPDPSRFENFPKAYFFRNLGQTYMFSGRGPGDTYAMFTCGSKTKAHKQYDENHFVIYKGGFLALDTGTRTASGYKDWLDDCWHDNNYAAHSIAHNVVLIRMEGEKWPGWPHPKYAVANHGGMYKTTGGLVKAFETNDLFTYICGDSTACYRKEKCRKMIRQFVFIQPDYFVVCDTVESVEPGQTQTWLLHSQNEPVESNDQFHFDEEAGRLFCRTFLPKDFKRTKVGGPGKEFWVDGKNYPLGKTRLEEYKKRKVKKTLWGNWRVELTAGQPSEKVRFLNLIQVGMKAGLQKMVPSGYVTEGELEGVRFTAVDGTVWTVLFDRTGLKGKIRAEKDGKTLLDSALTEKIQEQKAFRK